MAAKKRPISRMHQPKKPKLNELLNILITAWLDKTTDLGYMPFCPAVPYEYGFSDDGRAAQLKISVTYAFLARLPFIDQDKAEKWAKVYESEVDKALSLYGKNFEDWDNLTPGGTCVVTIGEYFKIGGAPLFYGFAEILDKEGEKLGDFQILGIDRPGGLKRLDGYSRDDLQELADEAANVLTTPARCIKSLEREFIDSLLRQVEENLTCRGQWYINVLHDRADRNAWFLLAPGPDCVEGKMAGEVEAISGSLAHPVFPRKDAVFVLVAEPAGKTDWKISIDGPFAAARSSLADDIELRKHVENPGQKPVFSRVIDIAPLRESLLEKDETPDGYIENLTEEIFRALGMKKRADAD